MLVAPAANKYGRGAAEEDDHQLVAPAANKYGPGAAEADDHQAVGRVQINGRVSQKGQDSYRFRTAQDRNTPSFQINQQIKEATRKCF